MQEVLEFVVTDIRWETSNSITVYIKAAGDAHVSYQAGQFLTLLIESNGRIVRRSYSLSSTPGVDQHVAFTVKEVVNGEVSRLLLKRLRAGMLIRALRPAGLFVLDDSQEVRDLVFIAAGSGITPIFALLKKALHLQQSSRCLLIYQNATESNVIYKDQLASLYDNFSERLQYDLFISRSVGGDLQNRLTKDILVDILQEFGITSNPLNRIFICGPLPFMRMANYTVRILGYLPEQVRMENFVVDYVPPPKFTISNDPRKVTVKLNERIIEFEVEYPKSILEAALDQSIELPYSCRGGRCSSCVARCTNGSVQMSINEVLTDSDLADGLVLPCVGYAETDLTLEYKLLK